MIKRIATTVLIAGTAALAVSAPALAAEPPLTDAVTSTGQGGGGLTDFSGAFGAFTAGSAQQTVSHR